MKEKEETGSKKLFPCVVLLIIAALVLVLSSCGGGGGGEGTPPDVILPDETPPTVVSTSPAPGATGVAVNGVISITFSEAMNPATLTPAAIRLENAEGIPIPGTISYSGLTVVFTPASPLTFSSSYTLVVSTAVQDLAGHPLVGAYPCTFVTAAPSPPSAGPAPPPDPVAVSVNGLVVVSWGAVYGATSYNIYMASRPGVTKDNYYNLPDGNRQSVYDATNCTFTFSGLINGTTYYFVVTAKDPFGAEGGESVEVSATPQTGATGPYTGDATKITDTSVHLEGNFINPLNETTSVWFEYGPTTAYGSATAPKIYAAGGQITVSVDLSGLRERTVSHYRLVTQNSAGLFFGQDRTFKTYAAPQVLLNNLDAPVGLVSDGTLLYWQEIYANRVRRYNKDNGSAELVANVQFWGNSGNISIDQTHAYWSTWNTIWRAELNGANMTTFSENLLTDISSIKIHPTGLIVRHSQILDLRIDSISRISLDGGTTTSLLERIPQNSENFGGDMVLDANAIYFCDYWNGTIQKMLITGGPVTTLAVGLVNPDGLLLDGNTLFVSVAGYIKKLSTSGGVVEEVAAVEGYGANMAKDGTNLYVATGNTISRIDLTTGTVTILVVGQNTTGTPIVDASHVYWLNSGNHFYPPMGSLNRISKY